MSKRLAKLTAMQVQHFTKPGNYGDGGGLYLQINPQGRKSWIFRYELFGRERYMGLGPLHSVGLADARVAAREARRCLLDKVDPLEKKRQEVEKQRSDQARELPFDACAKQYIEAHGDVWRSAKHRQQWENTLRTYASPHFGSVNARKIDTDLVLKALAPIWASRTETATRVRERIERVLAWAATRGYRDGENPARWTGHLEWLLPAPSKLKKVKHHAALPFSEIGAFFKALRTQEGVAAQALEFTILTACRTNEVLGASWSEVDLVNCVWTVPAERMKAGRVHRVPLGDATVKLLRAQIGLDAVVVFPGTKKGARLSAMAMPTVLQRLQRDDLTVHGFRSTFRDWAAEVTDYPGDLAEIALAHTVGTAVENAYRRSDLFEWRRRLMADWAAWCGENAPSNARPATDARGSQEKPSPNDLRPISQAPAATPILVGDGVNRGGPT
ncbi:MAG TPA: integrase arm-type DNA-binding domain-containing protein [Ramlibacter sp.]|uniref:tyrosine-type recombinase/integrase n=1 Tax=Ramlibacter sp. TaxID=1917967 RepID=UPI002BAAA59C|nr:integrase arm-type DNA-binding domain-containing protein [Ramlibacter sp.]HVZ46591.1 integrase arm-type DNA-binding domain-containing protein [Ramlibacter sp.]